MIIPTDRETRYKEKVDYRQVPEQLILRTARNKNLPKVSYSSYFLFTMAICEKFNIKVNTQFLYTTDNDKLVIKQLPDYHKESGYIVHAWNQETGNPDKISTRIIFPRVLISFFDLEYEEYFNVTESRGRLILLRAKD